MAEEPELSVLEEANRREREIILGARDNPKDTKLADGTPVIEAQRKIMEEHTKEGQQALDAQRKRVREQSINVDPTMQGKIQPQKGSPTTFTLIPDSEEQQKERFKGERMKRSALVDESKAEQPKRPPVTDISSGQPKVSTTSPEKSSTTPDLPR